jgi:hypothetical protein
MNLDTILLIKNVLFVRRMNMAAFIEDEEKFMQIVAKLMMIL